VEVLGRLLRRSGDGEILEGLVNLETLVTSLNAFETRDPRDSIYAVMDLAEDVKDMAASKDPHFNFDVSNQPKDNSTRVDIPLRISLSKENVKLDYPNLRVDYNLPFEEVAKSFVAFCIQSSNSLDIIYRPWSRMMSYMPQSGQAKISPRLPSWARPLEESVFEIREDGRHVRRRGDSFVGNPG
jgi:hypothetical protein